MENLDEDALIFKIDAYIKGRLSETETADFTKKITENTALAQQVARQRVHLEAIEILLEDDLRDKMNEWEAEEKPNNFNWKQWGLGVLGLAILGGFYYFFNLKNNNEIPINSTIIQPNGVINKVNELPEIKIDSPLNLPNLQQILPIKKNIKLNKKTPEIIIDVPIVKTNELDINKTNSVVDTLPHDILADANTDLLNVINDLEKNTARRGEEVFRSDSIAKSYRFMQQKDFNSAINTLEKAENTEGVFAKAIAYFLNRQYVQALPFFENLANLKGFDRSETAEYYAALCFLANGQKQKALQILTKMTNDKGHPYFNNAKTSLKYLGF